MTASTRIAITAAPAHDAPPHPGELSWDELVLGLSVPETAGCLRADCVGRECPHKTASPMWAPIRWLPEASRKTKTNVAGVSVLCLDVDHVPSDDELGAIYGRVAEWRHAVHATHSDRPGDRCVRILLAVSREMTSREAERVRAAVMEMLELPADPRARDPSRLYYFPNRPSDACGPEIDGTGYLFASADGRAIDVDAVLAALGPETERASSYSEYELPDFEGAPSPEAFEAAARALGDAWPDDDRHPAHLALAGALARAAWPVDLIAAFLVRVAEIDEPGARKHVDLAPGAARASVEKVRGGENVSGWPTVIEYVGEEAVAAARTALGLASVLPEPDPAFVAGLARAAERAAARSLGTSSVDEPAPRAPAAPSSIDLKASLRAAQKTLAGRKDADSLRDAELLKRVASGTFLTEDAGEDRGAAMCMAALAVVRATPPATTDEQVIRELLPIARELAADLPEIVGLARATAVQLPPLLARATASVVRRDAPLDEFVLDTQGPRAGSPAAANKHNFDVAMGRLGVELRFDRFGRKKIIRRTDAPAPQIVQDEHVRDLMFRCEEAFAFYPPKDKFYDYCDVVAHRNSFHPVVDYLDGLPEHDGATRAEEWLIRYAGVEDTPYVRAISRLVLVAAVRRVRQPGCKFDEMLILEGDQGTLKSSALKALCPDAAWFTDDFKLGLDTKTQMERTLGKWIVEAGELKGMSVSDQNDMKSNLSRAVDEARMAYGRETTVVPRQYVFIGTTNEGQYLRDPTGDRRYWPVTITRPFDLDGLLRDRDQIWAEASRLEREHPEPEYIRLAPELYAAAEAEQSKRRVLEPIHIVLADALEGCVGRIRTQDVWKLVGFHEERLPSSGEQRQISAALKALRFDGERSTVGGVRGTYYARGTGPQRLVPIAIIGSPGQGFRVRSTPAAAPVEPPPPAPTN